MKPISLGQTVAVRRLALMAALFVLAAGPAASLACATGADWANGQRDTKDPRLLAVPAAPVMSLAQAAEAPAPAAPPPTLNRQPSTSTSTQDTSIDAHAKGRTLYSFEADQVEMKTALAMFAHANNLNIVPDNDVTGMVTLSLHDLPLEQVMRALLEAADYSWQEEGGLIRVRNLESRTFPVDYLRLSRKGLGSSLVQLGSGGSGGGQGGGGGGGQSGGGGGGGGQGGSGAAVPSVTAVPR